MQDFVTVTGMVIKTAFVGEYDKIVTILTKERGKISAFARGARRQTSRFSAAANPFSFGRFKLFAGKSSYNIMEAEISNYFESLRTDFEGACYGSYFLEIADYYTRENNDEKEMLKLLYQSIRALQSGGLSDELVRYIFEIRSMVVNGEFPGIPKDREWEGATEYAVSHIAESRIEKLYTFTVSEKVLSQLREIAGRLRRRVMEKEFKSLEVLEQIVC